MIGSLCTGYGGLDMAAAEVLGLPVRWYAEYEPPSDDAPNPTQAGARLLAHRMPGVPNLGDITVADWTAAAPVTVLTAGYPCQPDSDAGLKKGTADARWIWPAVRDAIRDVGPRIVFLENVRGHLGRGFPGVVGDLADIGYDVRWCCVPASAVGAPHRRSRLFALAYPADADGARWADRAGSTDPTGGGASRHHAGRSGGPPVAHAESDGRARVDGGPGRETARGRRERVAPGSAGGGTPPDTSRAGWEGPRSEPEGARPEPRGHAATDPARHGRHERRTEPARIGRGPDAPERGTPPAHTLGGRRRRWPASPQDTETGQPRRGTAPTGDRQEPPQWGRWEPAIRRWEHLTGPAPHPVELGRSGNRRLNPAFSEWMMGLPAGYVTDLRDHPNPALSITRNETLRLIGNGVVPQAAAAALRWLLTDATNRAATG